MPDLLVKLYELPPLEPALLRARGAGVDVRRALAPERHVVCDWVRETFSAPWESETEVGFAREPVSVFVATRGQECVGFCCYDTSMRGFFGPVGVSAGERKHGIGAALSLSALHAMREVGYGYAIIGWAGPIEFYARLCGATIIEGSEPGVYRGMLRAPKAE